MKPMQVAIGVTCAYEIAAIATGKFPTVSTLCRKYRWAEVLFLSWLVVHLHRRQDVCTVVITERVQ